jgi:hypothetical protein
MVLDDPAKKVKRSKDSAVYGRRLSMGSETADGALILGRSFPCDLPIVCADRASAMTVQSCQTRQEAERAARAQLELDGENPAG